MAIDPTKSISVPITTAPFKITTGSRDTRFLNMLIYGKQGTGKTTFAASSVDVPIMGDVLLVDAESGDMALEDSPFIKNFEKVDRVRVENFKQTALVQEYLKKHCRARDANNVDALRNLEAVAKGVPVADIKEPRRYNTVIIDSLTEVDQFCLYQLLGINAETKLDADIDVAQFAEFRKNNQMMQMLVRSYRDLPMNVILVCAQQFVQDETKRFHFTPALTGKLSAQIQALVDIVGFLQVGKHIEGQESAQRRLSVQPVGNFDAKNRRASFKQPFIDNPTMTIFLKAVGLETEKK